MITTEQAGIPALAVREAIRRLTPVQRAYTKTGAIHGDFTMATVKALEAKGIFHLVIDSPNGQCGFMRLTSLGEAVKTALKSAEAA